MTDDEINQAIAEACGWTQFTRIGINGSNGWMHGIPPDGYGPFEEIPDYCNDLNAMHEAEKVLTDDQRSIFYPRWLGGFMSRTGPIYATAYQRAEAFVRTLGKWEEGK
jgi:hypothetical protein